MIYNYELKQVGSILLSVKNLARTFETIVMDLPDLPKADFQFQMFGCKAVRDVE